MITTNMYITSVTGVAPSLLYNFKVNSMWKMAVNFTFYRIAGHVVIGY